MTDYNFIVPLAGNWRVEREGLNGDALLVGTPTLPDQVRVFLAERHNEIDGDGKRTGAILTYYREFLSVNRRVIDAIASLGTPKESGRCPDAH